MSKRYFLLVLALAALGGCGKSECKKYTAHFCQDEKSPICDATKTKTKDWSADKCRIELNHILIEEQSKNMENELK